VNEYSGRYSVMDKEFYIPSPDHLAAQSTTNRQGREEVLQGEQAARVLDLLREDALRAYSHYENMLNEDKDGNVLDPTLPGLARELARMNLPVNFYTQWYWKIDLHNLMHFVSLRGDPHAQYEIRAYADVMLEILKKWVPMTFEAFMDYRLGAASLSAKGLAVVKALLKGQPLDQASSGMALREWRELHQMLDLTPHQGNSPSIPKA
jgi:thymidylate synthase (FAD)